MNDSSRVYVAGHRGLVGSALVRLVEQIGPRSLAEVAAEVGALARSLSEALRS